MKRLYRVKVDKKLAGVCGGIAAYFDVDPTLVRVIYLLFMVVSGIFPAILLYLLLWLIVPVKEGKN